MTRLRAVLIVACLLSAAPASAALTESRRLAAVYDTILQARFPEAEKALQAACPPAPAEACQALRVVSVWWQIQIDPESRQLDTRFNQLAAASIAASQAWTKREPDRGEAWFYLAASYGPLVQWRVLRGERLAAAREGLKIKDALEQALKLDPGIHDAHFGIGLYHYYADVAPAVLKLLRLVLLLPGGDKVQGLREMEETRDTGAILAGEASFQLQQIYLWYEQKPNEALEMLSQLDEQYGHNPLFLERIAGVHSTYLHDHRASAAAWETLMARARAGSIYDAARAEARARAALARERDAIGESDRARK